MRMQVNTGMKPAVLIAMAACAAAFGCTGADNGSINYCQTNEEPSEFNTDECGQEQLSGEYIISNGGELNELKDITWLKGSLIIEEGQGTPIDLGQLENLRCVTNDLVIRATPLTTLQGLESLRYVGGNLIIGERSNGNGQLTSLAALQSLTAVDGYLWIQDNPQLESLAGLSSLKFVGDLVGIVNNDALTDLSAIAAIDHVGGFLNIVNNDNLPTCSATALSEHLGGECRNVCVRGNADDACPNEEELCWYEGVQ